MVRCLPLIHTGSNALAHEGAVALCAGPWHPTSNGTGLYGWSKKTRFLARLSHFSARPKTSPFSQRAKFLVGESSSPAPFHAQNTSICAVFRAQNPKAKMSPSLPYNPVPLLAGPLDLLQGLRLLCFIAIVISYRHPSLRCDFLSLSQDRNFKYLLF